VRKPANFMVAPTSLVIELVGATINLAWLVDNLLKKMLLNSLKSFSKY
jgi:hypothetical protein